VCETSRTQLTKYFVLGVSCEKFYILGTRFGFSIFFLRFFFLMLLEGFNILMLKINLKIFKSNILIVF
jgi:hypothetical protein